jgi:hypothetical protein
MPWTVEYEPEKALAVITGSGQMSDEDARAQTAEAIRLLKRNQSNGILADYSEALSEVSLPGLYWLPDYCSALGAPWNLRVAVMLPRSRYRLESYQFFELVCKNAGYDVRLFEAREAAEEWLVQPRSVREPSDHPAHA